ncbi:MAG: hypothetical protein LQ340_004946 [Diploschistes diacapsis]|nr:MAG: hypothetical protein LQ340_004946 [Diploschistes diacapsis]
MSKEAAVYLHGHHKSVTQDHSRRTAQDSAAFLIPHIQPNFSILDIGCGTGTITLDLAALVPHGRVEGGDVVETVLSQARALAKSRNLTNAKFIILDANDLQYSDDHFDVVFCHQVLQHVQDPVGILKEMLRVAKPGGIVAAREADYKSFAWYPEFDGIQQWADLYQSAARASKGEPNAGRHLHVWARKAGFDPGSIQASWTSWRYVGSRAAQFAESWVDRALHSSFADTVRQHGLAPHSELERISLVWREWSTAKDALIVLPSGEIIYHK